MGTTVALATLAATLATVVFLVGGRSRLLRGGRRAMGSTLLARAVAPLPALAGAGLLLAIVATLAGTILELRDILLWLALVWASTLPWLARTRRWASTAHAGWSLTVSAGALYVVAMALWTIGSGLGWLGLVGAWTVWLLEVSAYILLLAYGWEIYESIGAQHWGRRIQPSRAALEAGDPVPFVSIHVPCHNEPPDLVIETLRSLLRLDYPGLEVLVIDNNTTDDRLWQPVAEFCARRPDVLRFHRLVDWPGYKAGALNYAADQTDPRAEVIGVVDADYQVSSDWLQRTVGAFRDPDVAFVQTPQDYRDWHHATYLRRLYFSYDYFFAVSQRSRDERGGAIFGGTMGLVRREALRAVGGWDEWCVTEDAELSLRLLEHGWTGHHLDESCGHGIMPLTFEALKRQRFRWCFGGMQILRVHWSWLLPWSHGSRLTRSQRLAYLSGGIQWFGDLLTMVFALVVMASLVDLAVGDGIMVHRLAGLLLVAVPALILMGVVRAVATVKTVGHRMGWRDAVGTFLVWLSLGWVVSLACARGLVEAEGVFMRTPKVRDDVHLTDIVRANRVELLLAALGGASIVTAAVLNPSLVTAALSLLLVVPVAGWVAAPAHSLAALRAELPDPLSRRRAQERDRDRVSARRAALSIGSFAASAAVTLLVVTVVQPGSSDEPQQTLGPVPGLTTPTRTTSSSDAEPSGESSTSPTRDSSTTTGPTSTPTSTTAPGAPSPTTTSPTGTTSSTTSTATSSTSGTTSTSTTTQPGSATGTPSHSGGSPTSRPSSPGKPTTPP
jgi:cellulose synthase/poly-beta-1,6-N-acetylglucosamine synthase-like glycosyltransferase